MSKTLCTLVLRRYINTLSIFEQLLLPKLAGAANCSLAIRANLQRRELHMVHILRSLPTKGEARLVIGCYRDQRREVQYAKAYPIGV